MLSLLLAASLAVAQVPDSAHVVLVATTDVHGRATGWDYLARRPAPGGLARVASVVDSLRRRYPGQVVLLDAGDLLQGDPFATYFGRVRSGTPHPVIEAMNLVGYDAATPGNHDFDFGADLLFRAIREAAFPYVSANIHAADGDTLLLPAFRVLRRQGVRVGVAGFTTPGTMVWNRSAVKGRVRVAPIDRRAGPTVEALRRSSDLAVVLAHSGLDGPSSYDTTGIGAEDAAAAFAGLAVRPDVVIVGHSHRTIADSVLNGVHFVQPRHHAAGVAVVHVDLRRREGRWQVTRVRGQSVSTGDRPAAEVVTRRLASAHEAVQAWVDEPLGLVPAPIGAHDARARPSPLQDFLLEVQRRRAGTQLAAGPVFNLRAAIEGDTVRRAHVLALYPYDNTLRAVRISGADLRAYLEWSARYFRVDPAGRVSIDEAIPGYDYDLVRGARYDIDLRQPVGDRIRGLSVGGRPVQPADSFTLALNSHRQTGAGGYTMLRGAPVVYDRGENIPELITEAIRSLGVLDPARVAPSEWRIVPEVAAVAVRQLHGVPADTLPSSPTDTVRLRLLATAGMGGDLLRRAAPVARAMDSLGAACDCPTLRLDAGDVLQGDLAAGLTAGRAGLETLERMRYAAGTLGERDFDLPLDSLRVRLGGSAHPWVVANVADSASGRRPEWLTPYRMTEVAGLRVATIGYITPAAKGVQPEERTAGLRFGDGELAIHDVLAEVRALAPDLTVVLAHVAASCDTVLCDRDAVRLAEQLGGSGVDLVIAGHTGSALETQVAGLTVVGPGEDGVAVVDLVRTPGGGRVLRADVTPIPAAAGGAAPGPLGAALERLARRTDSLERRVVAQMKRPLRRGGGQHALGSLIAEARRNVLRADLGLVRSEAIRGDLEAGPVTYASLAAVEPGAADLVRVTMEGAQLALLLEQAVAGPDGPAVHLAGATVRYDPRARAGRRVRQVAFLGGARLEPRRVYTVATDEATAAGAGGLAALRGRRAVRQGLLDIEAVAAYLRRLPQPVEAEAVPSLVSTRR